MKSSASLTALIVAAGLLAIAAPPSWTQASSFVSNGAVSSAALPLPAESALVQARLDQFDSALAAHDVARLQATGINPATAKRWQRFFKDNPDAQVTDRCPVWALDIAGDTASWECTESGAIVSDGKPVTFEHVIHFRFAKRDGVWIIADRK